MQIQHNLDIPELARKLKTKPMHTLGEIFDHLSQPLTSHTPPLAAHNVVSIADTLILNREEPQPQSARI